MNGKNFNLYTILVILVSILAAGTLAGMLIFYNASTAVDSTTVGNIYIGHLNNDDAKRKTELTSSVRKWKQSALYTITFQGVDLVIGYSQEPQVDENGNKVIDEKTGDVVMNDYFEGLYFLDFDYAETTKHLQLDKGNLAYYTWNAENKTKFEKSLVDTFGEKLVNGYLEVEVLEDAIELEARAMTTNVTFDLYDYLSSGWTNDAVKKISLSNIPETTVDMFVKLFEGERIEFLPQEETENKLGFSAVNYFSADKFNGLTSAELSIIATGLAAVVQETSFSVTVKNQGYISDRYYAYNGMSARINVKDGTDLRIINPESTSYFVTITKGDHSAIDDTCELVFTLNGCHFLYNYEITRTDTIVDFDIEWADKGDYIKYDDYVAQKAKDAVDNTKLAGIDEDYQGGCYYIIDKEGVKTYLIAYTKTARKDNGEIVSKTEVYPKQEFYEGNDEYRYWTTDKYDSGNPGSID